MCKFAIAVEIVKVGTVFLVSIITNLIQWVEMAHTHRMGDYANAINRIL